MTKRIIMGIDPGTSITGYGLISCQGKKMELLTAGVIKLGKQEVSHPEKLKKIFQRITSLIREFKPQEIALEAPFYGKNVQSMLKLGRAQGVAMAAGLMNDLPIFEYAPKKVKSAVTGNGNASKEQVSRMLVHLINFNPEGAYLDASDGLAVAVCHFFQGNNPTSTTGSKDWSSFIKDNPGRVKK